MFPAKCFTTLRGADNLKLQAYNLFRDKIFVMAHYPKTRNTDIRKYVPRFRVGSNWLEIQQGRFTGTVRHKRICDL
jgi:hypothetical protein